MSTPDAAPAAPAPPTPTRTDTDPPPPYAGPQDWPRVIREAPPAGLLEDELDPVRRSPYPGGWLAW